MTDGGDLTLRCSQCGRGLAVVKVLDPHPGPPDYRVRATCGYGCRAGAGPDHSFWAAVSGRPMPAPFAVPHGPNPEDQTVRCKVVDFVTTEAAGAPTEVTLVTKAA